MKTKAIIIVLIILLASLFTGYSLYKIIHPNLVLEVTPVNNSVELVRYNSGEVRLRSITSHKLLTAKYDQIVFRMDDTIGVINENGLRGYVSTLTGKVIIPAQYTHAWIFSQGLACVTNSSDLLGVIDIKGEIVVPFKYKYLANVDYYSECEVDYVFHGRYCMISDSTYFGMLDTAGKEIVPPIYEDLSFQEKGYVAVLRDDLWGLYDSTFQKIMDHKYDNITIVEDGILVEQGNWEYLLSFDGKETISEMILTDCQPLEYISNNSANESICEAENGEYLNLQNTENICKGWTVVYKGIGYGLMRDSDQKMIIPCNYDEIKAITDKLFICQIQGTESYLLFDSNGKMKR